MVTGVSLSTLEYTMSCELLYLDVWVMGQVYSIAIFLLPETAIFQLEL